MFTEDLAGWETLQTALGPVIVLHGAGGSRLWNTDDGLTRFFLLSTWPDTTLVSHFLSDYSQPLLFPFLTSYLDACLIDTIE